jgi:hypothetical protein
LNCGNCSFGVGSPTPIANPELSAPIRVSGNQNDNEDPTAIVGLDKLYYVAWSAKQGGRANLVLRSSREGRIWTGERRITDGPGENYYPSLAQSRDGVFHLAWFRLQRFAGRRDIWYANSSDARQWSQPIVITNQGKDWAPAIYEDAQAALWIVWSSGRSDNRELFAVRSDDGGRRWSEPRQITRSPEEDDFPHAIQTPSGARILAWTRYHRGSSLADYFRDGSAEIVAANSRDGVSWSSPVVVSPPDPEARHVDFLPHLFPDHQGQRVFVSWTSGRPGNEGGILVREFAAAASPVFQLTTRERSG